MRPGEELRQTGRTTKLLETLRENGGIFVVHSAPAKNYTVGLIRHLRVEGGVKHIEVVVILTKFDADSKLRGLTRPVVIDHEYYERVSRDLVAYVKALASHANMKVNFKGGV